MCVCVCFECAELPHAAEGRSGRSCVGVVGRGAHGTFVTLFSCLASCRVTRLFAL